MKYYLVLGSNIAPQISYLRDAILKITQFSDVSKISSVYCSNAYVNSKVINFLTARIFYNVALLADSSLEPVPFLENCQHIEKKFHKIIKNQHQHENHTQPTNKVWHDRRLDIDIALIDNLCINNSRLVVPHYDLKNRDFFLQPLLDIIDPQEDAHNYKLLQKYFTQATDIKTNNCQNLGVLFKHQSFFALKNEPSKLEPIQSRM